MNKVVKANQGAYQTCSRQTVADAGATARRAIAITRNGLEAAKGNNCLLYTSDAADE